MNKLHVGQENADDELPSDDGYISNFLIHWTGTNKKTHEIDDHEGARVLSLISSSCELKLSANRIHWFHRWRSVSDPMVCFTDVPLRRSAQHCSKYGHFGIAFRKLKLMNKGAQPVFYASHACKADMDVIHDFLQKEQDAPTIAPKLFQALHRHFYFVQRLSDGRADGHDTFYYEREWRLGIQSLFTKEEEVQHRQKARLPGGPRNPVYTGLRIDRGNDTFFSFDKRDVAFLVVPDGWETYVDNRHKFPMRRYEDLVKTGTI